VAKDLNVGMACRLCAPRSDTRVSKNYTQLSLVLASITTYAIGYILSFSSLPIAAMSCPLNEPLRKHTSILIIGLQPSRILFFMAHGYQGTIKSLKPWIHIRVWSVHFHHHTASRVGSF